MWLQKTMKMQKEKAKNSHAYGTLTKKKSVKRARKRGNLDGFIQFWQHGS